MRSTLPWFALALALTSCAADPATGPDAMPPAAVAVLTDDIACPGPGADPELAAACERMRAEVGEACVQAQTPGDRLWCLARYLERTGSPLTRAPHETVTVGRYRGDDRSFTYLAPLDPLHYGTAPARAGAPPVTTCGWTFFDCASWTTADDSLYLGASGAPRAHVNAIDVGLRFEYRSCPATAHLRLQAVTVGGAAPPEGTVTRGSDGSYLAVIERTAPAGDGAIDVELGHASAVGWALWCDGGAYTATDQGTAYAERRLVGDALAIARPPQLGAFTIPALPVSIAYAPVQNQASTNVATTTLWSALALEVTTEVSDESSHGVPVEPALWQGAGAMKDVFDLGARIFGAAKPDEVKALGYAFEAAGKLVGTASATSTDGRATTEGERVTVQFGQSRAVESATDPDDPGRRLGPGPGDQILYVPDFHGIWAVTDDRVWLRPTAPPGLANVAVADLLLDLRDLAPPDCRGARTHLAAAELRLLLSIDPNVVPPPTLPCGLAPWQQPRLEAPRFEVVLDHEGIRRDRGPLELGRDASTCGTTTSRSWTARVETYSPGVLQSALGTQAGTLTTRLEHVTRGQVCTTERRTASLALAAAEYEQYDVRAWYDRELGSFLVTPYGAPGGQPLSDPADGDGDGVPDQRERELGADPTRVDSDGDGLADGVELTLGTSPTVADSDGDGVDDRHDDRPWCVACTWLAGGLTVTAGSIPATWTGQLVIAPGPAARVVNGPATIE